MGNRSKDIACERLVVRNASSAHQSWVGCKSLHEWVAIEVKHSASISTVGKTFDFKVGQFGYGHPPLFRVRERIQATAAGRSGAEWSAGGSGRFSL